MTIMKKQFLRLTVFAFFLFTGSSLWGQYGIGTNNPNASAALEIVSPDKGLLIPTVSLTSTSLFSPITGTPGVSHDGMIIWNDSTSTANDLQGVGFYYWEGGAAGHWYKLSTDAGVDPGTVTNATLRWNGSSWVEDTTFLNSGTGTATFASNITVTGTLEVSDNASITANLTVTGTTEITGNTTVTADFEVGNNTSLGGTLEVTGNATITGDTVTSGALTAQDTVTLEAALVDSMGNTGTAGQILSSTSTSTEWIDNTAPESGTTTNSTLRWNGSSWVEDTTFLNSGTGTATFASNITVTGTLEVSDNASITANLTVTGTTEITGNTTVTADFEVGNNTSLGGTLEVTGNATITGDTVTSGALTAQDTVTLEAALVDSIGNTGTDGQVLSSTGTSTKWVDPNALTMATMTVTGNVTSTVRLLLLEPAATMTVTLPAIADVPTGYQILIRRNQGYIGSGDLITLTGNASEQINGNTTKNMNVGYQSVTLIRTPSGWISID